MQTRCMDRYRSRRFRNLRPRHSRHTMRQSVLLHFTMTKMQHRRRLLRQWHCRWHAQTPKTPNCEVLHSYHLRHLLPPQLQLTNCRAKGLRRQINPSPPLSPFKHFRSVEQAPLALEVSLLAHALTIKPPQQTAMLPASVSASLPISKTIGLRRWIPRTI